MNEHDTALAEYAQVVIQAYNGSFKPHLVKFLSDQLSVYEFTHSDKGFCLLRNGEALTTDKDLSAFIVHVFLVTGGYENIDPKEVFDSPAVQHALRSRNMEYMKCTFCHHEWVYKTPSIPIGSKYEIKCPSCGALLMRKMG